MFRRRHAPLAPRLLAGAALAFAAVGIAVALQHFADQKPCPWCVLQRLLMLGVGAAAALAAAFASARVLVPARATAALAAVLASAGLGAALYQYGWAASSTSCALTFADRVMMRTGLDEALPWLFKASASCDVASTPLLGVPWPLWSAAVFVALVWWLGRTALGR